MLEQKLHHLNYNIIISAVSSEAPETPYKYVKIVKKFFAIKKRAFYCREDSTVAFLLVYFTTFIRKNTRTPVCETNALPLTTADYKFNQIDNFFK